MKFTKEMLLPRFRKQQNPKLEKFIVSNINNELKKIKNKDCNYDLVQMQYFFESVFESKIA
jgi:hypothetical protein